MRLVMLLILITYIITASIVVKHFNELLVSKILKIFVFILYCLILLVIAYITLFVFMFGYNS